jgi:thiaminase (transcriptional activator TenA)
MGTNKSMKTTQDLWDNALSIIHATEQHPFLLAMVNGTLEIEKFQYYIIQDLYYLHEFAFCIHHLSSIAPSSIDSKRLTEFAQSIKQAEMALHNSFCKEWNITIPTSINTNSSSIILVQMPNTLLYTSYMKQVVTTRPYAEGLSALLPCFWIYAHVGDVMIKLRKEQQEQQRPPVYDAWIDMYGGEDFHKDVNDYRNLVEKELSTADESTFDAMKNHFIMACELEYMFWDQALTCMTWPHITTSNSK